MSTHTPTIHEFSTGIYIEWLAGNRWRSKGFTGGWNNNTFGNKYGQVGIPAALDAAIRNKQFEVRAAEQEAAVVGRVVQRQGDPEIWAVVAVVSNAVDNRARGLPVWRYFCCVCTDLTNANLELIRLLGRLDAFNATYGGLPAFDPQTLSGNQSNLAQILPANRPTSEPKSAEYQDALNATNTVILPLVLDAGTCHSYYQLLSLASNIASVQNRFISWAWNVAEVEQPGAFVAIQMAAGFALRMRQAAAPVAAIAAGSDVAALAAVLQEFGRNQQVKEETVQKLDDLLRQDPGLKDPEILRQTYRQFGIEANKKDLKIFQLEQLVNPQQIRALTLWPVLDPQMLPEYQRWCGLFPQSTKQGQIPLVFERELKVLLPQFRNLEAVVGENVVWISWELFQKGKISGAELARQLTDTNSLFAPASDVVCQTLGKRLMQVEQECQQVRQRQVLAQNSELDQQNYFWSDVKSYLQEWSGKDDRQLAASGIYHPLFVTQGPVGQGGVNSSSQGWESWFNIVEGLLKAISVFRSLMNVQQILNRLPSPNHCSQKYSELLTFLDVLCRKPQYKPYFHDLNQFLKFALQPASISASESDRWLKAIGYVIKPIVGVFTLSMVVIVTYLTLVAPVFQALGKAWQGFVANFGSSTSSSGGGTSDPWSAFSVLFWGIVLFILAIVIIALVTSPSIQAKVSELFKGVNRAKWLTDTSFLLESLSKSGDNHENEKELKNTFNEMFQYAERFAQIEQNDLIQAIYTNFLHDCNQKTAIQRGDNDDYLLKHQLKVRFALAELIIFAGQKKFDTRINVIYPLFDRLRQYIWGNPWNLDFQVPGNVTLHQDLQHKALKEVNDFSKMWHRYLEKNNSEKIQNYLESMSIGLTRYIFIGLLEDKISKELAVVLVGLDSLLTPQHLLRSLAIDKNNYQQSLNRHLSKIWKPLCEGRNPAGTSENQFFRNGYTRISNVLRIVSSECNQDNESSLAIRTSQLADVFSDLWNVQSPQKIPNVLDRLIQDKPTRNSPIEIRCASNLKAALALAEESPTSPMPPASRFNTPGQNLPVQVNLAGQTMSTQNSSGSPAPVPTFNSGQIPWWNNLPSWLLTVIGTIAIAVMTVAFAFFFLVWLPQMSFLSQNSPDNVNGGSSQLTSEVVSNNQETFQKLKEELDPITDHPDDSVLAERIAQQERFGEQWTKTQASLIELWADENSWSEQNQKDLFEWVKELQRKSGLQEEKITGYLTTNDSLYRVLKRRTSRDIAIASPKPPTPWKFPDKSVLQEGDTKKDVAIVQEYLKAIRKLQFEREPPSDPGTFDSNTTALVKAFQTSQTKNPDTSDGEVGLTTWNNLRKEGLKKTVSGIRELLDQVNKSCSVSGGTLAILGSVKLEIDTLLPQATDPNQGKLINWDVISQETVNLADPGVKQAVYDFETALVRYKYPLVDVMEDPHDSSKSITIEAIPTLIFDQDSDYDKDTLYDLELGVRQQLKCWTGVEQSPFAPENNPVGMLPLIQPYS